MIILDYVYSLLNKAQRSFHEMFLRTYGIMYQKNADVFQVNKIFLTAHIVYLIK